jgi:long-chain acyl-CoA synthetase
VKELVYPRILLPRAERLADKTASVDVTAEGVAYEGTLGAHVERVRRLCHALRTELGVGRGDRFGVLALNGHAFIELYHAALFGAGVINPLNIRFSPAEVAAVLADSGTRVVFTDVVFASVLERAVAEEGARLDRVVVVGGGAQPPAPGGGVTPVDYDGLLAAAEPEAPAEPDEDDPVVLMYTGGTTGRPKGVLLDQRAEVLNAYHVAMALGVDEDRRFLFQSPMFHAAVVAAVLAIPASGATSVSIPLFDPDLVLDVVPSQRIDCTMAVPVMLSMLERLDGFDPGRLRSLRQLVYGAAPISQSTLRRWLDWLPETDFFQGYGMTEAASVVTFLGPDDHRGVAELLLSAGSPVLGVELRIEDAAGRALGPDDVGEVCVRGGNLMRGYWERPDESAAALRDGWYHTGDVGYLDDRGYLFLTDRVNDMIVTGGENVYSTEVETVLAAHPAVEQVAVIGIPSEEWGEAVHAVVVLKPGASASAEELIEFARRRLAGYKVPKSVEFRTDPLPLSGAFKPLKRELRRPYWQGRGRQVG